MVQLSQYFGTPFENFFASGVQNLVSEVLSQYCALICFHFPMPLVTNNNNYTNIVYISTGSYRVPL